MSVHQQLMTQISLQIAAGQLAPGSKLPSVRALATKLNVHYNTCLAVYQALAHQGLLFAKAGSGFYVTPLQAVSQQPQAISMALPDMCRYVVQWASQQGHSLDALMHTMQQVCYEASFHAAQFVFADAHADILPLFQAELTAILQQPVLGLDLNQSVTELSSCYGSETVFFVSRYHEQTLKRRLNNSHRIVTLELNNASQERIRLQRLPSHALVVVVSVSGVVLQMADAVIQGIRGQDILVRTVHWEEGKAEVEYACQHAAWILADVLCAEKMASFVHKAISPLWMLPQSEHDKIRTLRLG